MPRNTILVLTSRFPYPLEKGDKLRIYNQLRHLSENSKVVLIALSSSEPTSEHLKAVSAVCSEVHVLRLSKLDMCINLLRAFFSGLPFQVSLFYKPAFAKKISSIMSNTKPDAIYCHLIRMSEYVKHCSAVIKTLDYMDAFSKGMERRAAITPPPMKYLLRNEMVRLARYEKDIFDAFHNKVIISAQDRDCIPHDERGNIVVIPNGVDPEVYYPLDTKKKYDLLFTGNMSYPPNIESALYTIKEVLPLLHKKDPSIRLLIAGVNPPHKVLALRSDKVHVEDSFPHIRDAFAQSRVMIAPMLISIGLQNKILQAMAMKIPTVCSTLANNAIGAPRGSCILEANSPQEYADNIWRLLQCPGEAEAMAANALSFVRANYSWASVNEKLRSILFTKSSKPLGMQR